MLSQEWITRMTSATADDVAVVGRGPDDDARDAWTLRYCARFVERGVPLRVALEIYNASDSHDYEESAEHSADTEMSYWDDDGQEG